MRTVYSLFSSLKNRLNTYQYERKDFQTSNHIIVFESDDWGSIRMSNKKDWDKLLELGYAVDKRPYERFDTLESAEDLEALFEVLSKYRDCNGNHPVITANMLMANPDFERIEKSGYKEYYYEPIERTYTRYYGNTKVLDLMRQGWEEGVFMPQSHGREHFNVAQWMRGLQDGDEDMLTAFKYGMCGIAPKVNAEQGNQMMVALRASNEKEQQQICDNVEEGLQLFERLWGFKSKSFVAPCYTWDEKTEQVLCDKGVELIQTARFGKPAFQYPQKYYFAGQKNQYNQVYSIRNCFFEPATNEGGSTVENLLRQVDITFSKNKIAVFSTHRINYVGGLFEQNRTQSLVLFDEFLKKVLEKYPDLEFMHSDSLINVLS